jgi:CubicO group peptidase (beta-lactamase class C family)
VSDCCSDRDSLIAPSSSRIEKPSTFTITSPGLSPAIAAELFGRTSRREPRAELRVAAVGVNPATRGEPYLLHDVVELMAIAAEQPLHQHPQARCVAIVQRPKSRLIAVEKAANECGVGQVGAWPDWTHTPSVGRSAKRVASGLMDNLPCRMFVRWGTFDHSEEAMRKSVRWIGVALSAFIASQASAQNPATIEHHLRYGVRLEGQPDITLEILDRMKAYHVPGVSIAVIDNWRVVYAKGFGVTTFGGTQPVDSTTLFLAGSISKPIFASGFLRLVEDRKLSLDADVNSLLTSWHLPESRFTEHEKVTLRRLLTHSAGLTVWGFPGYALGAPIPTVPQILDGAPPANTPAVRNDTTPGARWLYSGGGMTIAQLVATDVSGESFPSLMDRLMLRPAGMARSTYENPLPVGRRGNAATGHERLDTPVPGGFHVYPEMAAAGLWTNASDLARWAIALAHSYRGEAGGVLSTTMAKQMVSKQMHQQPPYGNGYWGLGVAVSGEGDSLSFSHNGRDEGFVADMVMLPNLGRGLVVMMNGVQGGLMGEIQRAFAEEYAVGPSPRLVRKSIAMAAPALAAYTGKYVGIAGRDTVVYEVSVAPGGMLLASNVAQKHAVPIVPVAADAFIGLEGGGAWTFERAGAGVDAAIKSLAIGAGPNRTVLIRQ